MARTRSIPDETVLDGALAAMRRAGPDGVTFAAVAAETGLAPATLVQRFGSKADLLRAALLRAWTVLDRRTEEAIAAAPLSPAGAVGLLVALSTGYGEGAAFADGLLVLREDMRDPDLRQRGARWGDRLAGALGRRLGDDGGDRPDLGRLMAAQWQGIVLWWGFAQDAPLAETVERRLRDWCAAVGRPAE